MMGLQGLGKSKKSWGGCHHLFLVYDASKLSTVYVVKSPVFSLKWRILSRTSTEQSGKNERKKNIYWASSTP